MKLIQCSLLLGDSNPLELTILRGQRGTLIADCVFGWARDHFAPRNLQKVELIMLYVVAAAAAAATRPPARLSAMLGKVHS